MRLQMIIALLVAFGLGVLAGQVLARWQAGQGRGRSLRRDAPRRRCGQRPGPSRRPLEGYGLQRHPRLAAEQGGRPHLPRQADRRGPQAGICPWDSADDRADGASWGQSEPVGRLPQGARRGLHHVAFRIPDTGPELEKYRGLGLEAIASGKWPEGQTRWGTFHYVQDPKGGAIVEFISRIPRQ